MQKEIAEENVGGHVQRFQHVTRPPGAILK